jgi:hypothetical protein
MEFARIIKEECAPMFDVRFYANFRAEMKVVLSLPAQPICHDGIYPPAGDFENIYRTLTASTVGALKKINSGDADSEAILIMHTVSLYQLGGIARWFSTLPPSRRPRLCIQFQFPLEYQLARDTTVYERAIALARAAADVLAATGRTRFAANSALLAGRISQQLKQQCTVLPLPTRWSGLNGLMSPDRGLVYGFFGGLRAEKGASLIAQAVPAFASCYPDARFLVHAPRRESDSSAISALEKVAQVELINKNFDVKADYFKQFTRASCILLPYDPEAYAYRTSGILVEALGLNRLIITTKNSWLSSEAARRGGNVIEMADYTADSLFSALTRARELLKNIPIKPTIDHEVISENSPKAFCSALLKLVSDF